MECESREYGEFFSQLGADLGYGVWARAQSHLYSSRSTTKWIPPRPTLEVRERGRVEKKRETEKKKKRNEKTDEREMLEERKRGENKKKNMKKGGPQIF